MAGPSFRLFWKVLVVLLLLSPFFLFSSSLKPASSSTPIGRLTQEVVYPFQYAWYALWDYGTELWEHYMDLVGVKAENSQLKEEIRRLRVQQLDYQEKVLEIDRLRKMMGFDQHFSGGRVVAEVIRSPKDIPFETVRIGKGEQAGLRVGMPVVTGDGVMGRLIRVGSFFSDVQLLVDANFHLDVLLQRTRARGVLRGDFVNRATLRLNRRAEVRIGDTVITSGIVGGFPKGIPVGQVVRISYESDHITQTIQVEPWVNYDQVEEVVVLQIKDRDTEKIVETAGAKWLEKSLDAAGGQF